jgi:hypothetical protein
MWFLFQIRISLGKEIQGKPCLEDSEWSSTEVSDQLKSWFRSLFIVRKAGSRIVHAFEAEVRVGESFFDYEYLREFEAKIRTAGKVVQGIYEEPISAKTPENPPHCHVPLKG